MSLTTSNSVSSGVWDLQAHCVPSRNSLTSDRVLTRKTIDKCIHVGNNEYEIGQECGPEQVNTSTIHAAYIRH